MQGERLIIAVLSVAGSELVLKMAIQYAKEREQFGKPIFKNQAIAHRIADLATKLEASRRFLPCAKNVQPRVNSRQARSPWSS